MQIDRPQPNVQWLERCGRFSPIVGLEPFDNESILLDITGLAHLFGGETALIQEILREFTRLGATIRIAIADTIGAAWAVANYQEEKGEEQETINRRKQSQQRRVIVAQNTTARCGQSSILSVSSCSKTCAQNAGDFRSKNVFAPPFTILPPGEAADFLSALPIEALRLPGETVRLLHDLGIRQIGQVEALPRDELLSRFSDVLRTRLDQAMGRLDEPVPACPIPPTFVADWSPEHPAVRRETICAALEHLIRRVAAMLNLCGRGALRLECRLNSSRHTECAIAGSSRHAPRAVVGYGIRSMPTTNGYGIRSMPTTNGQRHTECDCYLSIGLFQPTAAAEHLFQLVLLQLERLRLPAAITDVHVEVSLTALLERKQAMLFDFGVDGSGQRQSRHLASLVERLSSRLGSKAVVGVRLRPEAQPELSWHYDPLVERRQRRDCRVRPRRTYFPKKQGASRTHPTAPTDSASRHGTRSVPATLPPRPLRLLPRPLRLAATSIVPGGPPLLFHFAGQEHQIAQTWGPERIETGWWRGRSVGRDYFRVESTTGRRFWLFRRLRDENWFLHGMFE